MSTLRRLGHPVGASIAALLIALVVAAGCTDEASPAPDGSATSSPPGTPSDDGATGPLAGKYLYQNAGLRVTADFDGTTGTLFIINNTGRDVPEPSLYVRDATDGHRVEGTVDGAGGIADGKRKEFDFEFPPAVTPGTIGLLFLVMGEDDYGAFIPPAAA